MASATLRTYPFSHSSRPLCEILTDPGDRTGIGKATMVLVSVREVNSGWRPTSALLFIGDALMVTLSLRTNYRPLCDRHHSEMMPMSTLPNQSENTHRCCAEAGCTRHYDAFDGYYDWVNQERLQGKFDSPYDCRQHESKMYLASYHERTNIEIWVCPFDCQQSQTVRER